MISSTGTRIRNLQDDNGGRRCSFGLLYGNLYAIGGWVGEDIGGSIEKYDPGQNEWRLEGDLPEPRFSMGAVSYDGEWMVLKKAGDSGSGVNEYQVQ